MEEGGMKAVVLDSIEDTNIDEVLTNTITSEATASMETLSSSVLETGITPEDKLVLRITIDEAATGTEEIVPEIYELSRKEEDNGVELLVNEVSTDEKGSAIDLLVTDVRVLADTDDEVTTGTEGLRNNESVTLGTCDAATTAELEASNDVDIGEYEDSKLAGMVEVEASDVTDIAEL
ncbi:hypothetical protein ACOMHN_018202 [Nucella lapillus]